ncbi:MAG: GTP 3',8-cyclase MoaA [Alteromonadaceae bacterium]|nr:MAG: GTP 3',8-cyclase MoaA [Alteromonadaceae bacterium]
MKTKQLQDPFGRKIDYLRISITDRCDFRCIYCMAEDMTFLPRKDVLSLEEITRLTRIFVDLGVSKVRVTGGEPLIRNDALVLFQQLGGIEGLDELCLTSNGSQLVEKALPLVKAGVNRINISLDTLDSERFRTLTRHGKLDKVLAGIDAAIAAGFDRIKLNAVLMKNYNLDEAADLAKFALERGIDISFIEEMPLGEITSHARDVEFISSQDVRDLLSEHFTLKADSFNTGGPSRYWSAEGYDSKIGFISPHSENFCASCNRVRVTATGRLLLCLGNEHSVDLRDLMRSSDDDRLVQAAIVRAITIKPEKHEFNLEEAPQIVRFMNTTGG